MNRHELRPADERPDDVCTHSRGVGRPDLLGRASCEGEQHVAFAIGRTSGRRPVEGLCTDRARRATQGAPRLDDNEHHRGTSEQPQPRAPQLAQGVPWQATMLLPEGLLRGTDPVHAMNVDLLVGDHIGGFPQSDLDAGWSLAAPRPRPSIKNARTRRFHSAIALAGVDRRCPHGQAVSRRISRSTPSLTAFRHPTLRQSRLESQGAHMTARWRGNGVPIDEPLAMLVCGSADVPARSAPASSSANRGTSGP